MTKTRDETPLSIASDTEQPRQAYKRKQQAAFFEELARTSNITVSAKKAGLALSTIYHWQNIDDAFAASMLQALARGYERLEMEMLARMREGVERTIYYQGEVKETVREYDHANAIRLLRVHKEAVALTRAAETEFAKVKRDAEQPDTLEEKLARINRRLKLRQADGSQADRSQSDRPQSERSTSQMRERQPDHHV